MSETIAAVSTAYGEGGIGIVRISGSRAEEILSTIFCGPKLKTAVFSDKHMRYGFIKDPASSETIDEVLAVLMRAPHTYTGEDVAEIQCHGSMVSLRRILALVLACGAKAAEAGEFTKRAFLNGRIDLAQADAVIDIIRAKTDEGFRSAVSRLQGRLSEEIGVFRDRLTDILAMTTLHLDYPDEAEELLPGQASAAGKAIEEQLRSVRDDVKGLADTADTGMLIRDGIHVVIAGKPNAGKSSLMNALLRESRAIVTEIPGTTRDTIEAWLNVDGIPVRLTDTAGLREAENPIEQEGVKRTKDELSKADLRLFLIDGSLSMDDGDVSLMDERDGKPAAIVISKADLKQELNESSLEALFPGLTVMKVSAVTGEGIGDIEGFIRDSVYGGRVKQNESLLITNMLHRDLLYKAAEEMDIACECLESGEALDFAEINMREAHKLLGEITGETITDEILERVFSRFCVGK